MGPVNTHIYLPIMGLLTDSDVPSDRVTKKLAIFRKNGHLPNATTKFRQAARNLPTSNSLRQHAPGKANRLIIYRGHS
jgi:hypothetical protein